MVKIKICGNTSVEDALLAVGQRERWIQRRLPLARRRKFLPLAKGVGGIRPPAFAGMTATENLVARFARAAPRQPRSPRTCHCLCKREAPSHG